MNLYRNGGKRALDITLALAGLPFVGVATAIATPVLRKDGGPALYRSTRLGLNQQPFTMLKFRSMAVDAADLRNPDGSTFNAEDDPRVTPAGRFMRRTSLDELPQFWNVLQGRMSIVGPRPHAVAHNAQYRQLVRAYMVRHKVRPGITGWAQVHGLRGLTDTDEKMARRVSHDLWYIDNWSFWLDVAILLRTVFSPKAFRNAG